MTPISAAIGRYRHTEALFDDPLLNIEPFPVISRVFAPMIRTQRFDISEMAIVTFPMARGAHRTVPLEPHKSAEFLPAQKMVGAIEVGAVEDGAEDFGVAEVGRAEVGGAEMGTAKIGRAEGRLMEVSVLEVCVGQIGPAEGLRS